MSEPSTAFPQNPQNNPAGSYGLPAEHVRLNDAFGNAWEIIKKQWPFVLLAVAISTVLPQVIGFVLGAIRVAVVVALRGAPGQMAPRDPGFDPLETGLAMGSQSVVLFVTLIASAASIPLFLQIARGQPLSVAAALSGLRRFPVLLAVSLMYGVAVGLGIVMLVVPGVILALGLSLAPYYAVDSDLGPIESLKASWNVTTGYKADIFVFNFMSALLMLGGLIACGVGIIPATMVTSLARAIVYVRLSQRGSVVTDAALLGG